MAITIKKRDPSSIPNPDTGKVTLSVDLSENPYYKDETGTVFPAIVGLSSTTPQNVGTSGSAGTSTNASRADHAHALTFSTVNSILGAATGSISVNNQSITNLTDATNPQDALNLRTASATQVSKSNVYYATTTTLPAYTYSNGTAGVGATITGSSTGALSAIDGVSPQAGDSLLVKNETAGNAPNNGIYTVTNAGSVGVAYILTRRTDSDTAAKLAGAFCIIESGTINKSAGFVLSLIPSAITVGTTSLTFTQFNSATTYTGTNGVLVSGLNISAVTADNAISIGSTGIKFAIPYAGLVTGNSKTYLTSDRGNLYRRSNSGSAMTDTLPTLAAGDNGWTLKVHNDGTVVAETITFTSPFGNFTNGTTTYVLQYGCRQTFTWTGSSWEFDAGNANLVRFNGSAVAGNLLSFNDTTGRLAVDSGVSAAAVVTNTRQVIAGTGLTGGGALTSDVTLNVVANADGSIVVAADDVKVGVLATDAQHGNRGNGSLHSVVVSGGANGFMLGTDKTKLDGITSGAAVASVGATAPITSSGGTTPNIGITISPGGATTAVGTTRNLTAGTGLTGSGDLSADRTFNVVANADGSIVANADDIQVGVLATDAQHGNRGNGSLHTIVVAGGANGFMSGTDKTKLDSVTSGAAVASVSGTAPIVSSGGTTPAISVTSGDNAIAVTSAGLKFAIPFSSLVTGNSKTYVSGDRGNFYRRSNSGVAMTDTLPTLVSGDNGWTLKVHNDGTVAAEQITFTSPSGTFPGGGTTYVLPYGCRQTFTWTGTGWDFDAGNGNLLRLTAASVTSGNVPSFSDLTGRVVGDSGVVAANIVSNTRQVIAGAGLTGGGALTSDVTLNVVANADGSIVVAADDVKVGVLATDAQHGNRGNGSLHTVVVAGGNNGFMSGTDKTKLDGITSGAAVASVGATAPITSSGGTTPNIGITISPGAATTVVGTTRLINTTAPLTGGGDCSADRTLAISAATTTAAGSMSATDKIRMAQSYDAQADFGAVGDLISLFDGACSTGAPTKITSASALFTAYYLNKKITLSEAGASGGQYVGTITNIDSSTQVTVSPSISSTVSSKGLQFGTDNTTAFTAMMTLVNTTNAAFPGVKIIFGQSLTNAYGSSTMLLFNKSAHLEGIGSGFNTDNGDYTRISGTRLAWWGATMDGGTDFGAFITFQPGAGATQALKNPSIKNLWIDGRNGDQLPALMGIRMAGCHGPELNQLFIIDVAAVGVLMESTSVVLNPVADQGVLRPLVEAVHVRVLETYTGAITTPLTTSTAITLSNTGQNITVSAATMPTIHNYAWLATNEGVPCLVKYTGGGTTTLNVKCSVGDAIYGYITVSGGNVVSAAPINACCVMLSGATTSNTNCGSWNMSQLSHGSATWGPACIEIKNSDSMRFSSIYMNGGNNTNDGIVNRVRKPGLRLNGSNTNATLAARNNHFTDCSYGGNPAGTGPGALFGGLCSMGFLSNGSTRLLAMAGPNSSNSLQLGNNEPVPVLEGNGAFQWDPNGGYAPGKIGTVLVVQQASISAATLTQINGSIIPVPTASFFQPGVTYKWRVFLSKTAAGTAARTFFIRLGTTATTGDAVVATFTNAGVGTAAVGAGIFEATLTIRTVPASPGAGATAIAYSQLLGQANTGFTAAGNHITTGTMATFSTGIAQQFFTLSVTTGAAEVISVDGCICTCEASGNP